MQTIYDFAGSTNMWSTSVGGHLMKVVNLTGFTVIVYYTTGMANLRLVTFKKGICSTVPVVLVRTITISYDSIPKYIRS